MHLAAEIERSFPQFIAHYMERGRWQLVINGDFIDFWNVEIDATEGDAEALAVARLHAVLDDHPAVEDAITRFLEAGNGVEGLAALCSHDINLILLDLNMPVMNGEEFLEVLRADPRYERVSVVVVSTESNAGRLRRLGRLGITGFLHKPFEPEDLRVLACQALDQAS